VLTDDHEWRLADGAIRAAVPGPTTDPREEPLGDRAQLVLVAMLQLKAFDADSRQSTAAIAKRALGPGVDANSLKPVVSELVTRELIDSRTGRGGGCWLKPAGRERAEKLCRR
jgi:hypothetical protein